MNNKLHTSKLLRWGLLVLFSTYFLSISIFTHTHIVDNVLVVHSHPYKSSSHQHTTNALMLIDQISHFNVSDLVPPHFEFKQQSFFLRNIVSYCCIGEYVKNSVSRHFLRPPPSAGLFL